MYLLFKHYYGEVFEGWHEAVVTWYNEWCSILCENKKIIKRKLYLYGPTNVGKTSVIEKLIGKANLKFVFYPGVGQFFMQGFDPSYHKFIVFEEFDVDFYPVNMLKRLLECKTFSYPVKCQADLVMKFYGPIIMVSNFALQSTDNALRQRFFDVYAGNGYWTYGPASFPPFPIKEEDEYTSPPAYPLWELLEGSSDSE